MDKRALDGYLYLSAAAFSCRGHSDIFRQNNKNNSAFNTKEYPVSLKDEMANVYVTVYDIPLEKLYSIKVIKSDEHGQLLSGIEFYLQVEKEGIWQDYENTNKAPYAKTNELGELSFRNLPVGKYRVVEHSDLPQYGEPIYTPIDGVVTFNGPAGEQIVTVINPDIKLPNPVLPTIDKNINNKAEYRVNDLMEVFTWNITVKFGDDTENWTKVLIKDEIHQDLEVLDIVVKDQNTILEADINYNLMLENNLMIIELLSSEGGFAYLSGKSYVISISTQFKGDIDSELLKEHYKNGIINQAELIYDENNAKSNKPKVYAPKIKDDKKPVNTGDVASLWLWILMSMALLGIITLATKKNAEKKFLGRLLNRQ